MDFTAALAELKRVIAKHELTKPAMQLYDDYYNGKHRMLYASDRWVQSYGRQLSALRDNWMDLVVDAVEERLNVTGFRFGDNPKDDKDAARIWQANHLDADSQIAMTEALIMSRSYSMVWPNDKDPQTPTITIESAMEVYVDSWPGNRRRPRSAIKHFVGDDGKANATLYQPDFIYKFQRKDSGSAWEKRTVAGEDWPLVNRMGELPFTALRNKPRLLGEGRSEIRSVIPMQDAANDLLRKTLMGAEYAAFKQKWATGIELEYDENGKAIQPFDVGVDRLITDESTEVKFGEFAETNLENIVKVIEMVVQHIASQTRTPPHYFYLSGSFPSGESIKSAETGLVAKAHRKMRHFGEGWEGTMRKAFRSYGDPRGREVSAETIWQDPEYRTEGEHIDAVLKKKPLGVPLRQLWEDMGYTPAQMDRFAAMLKDEAAYSASMMGLATLLGPKPGDPPAA